MDAIAGVIVLVLTVLSIHFTNQNNYKKSLCFLGVAVVLTASYF